MYRRRKAQSTANATADTTTADKCSQTQRSSLQVVRERNETAGTSKIPRLDCVVEGDEMIPPSQPFTQSRFASQRSNLMVNRMSQNNTIVVKVRKSYFETVLSECGVTLDNVECFVLNTDHVKFIQKLQQSIKSKSNFPANIKDFVKGLSDTIEDKEQLAKLLNCVRIDIPSKETSLISHGSLMKNIVVIDCLQKDVIGVLLTKVKSIACDDNASDDLLTIPLIFEQLKFINHFANGQFLFNSTLDLLDATTSNGRQTIIASLEDVVDSSRHDELAVKIMKIISDEEEFLNPAIINMMANISLSSSIQSQVRNRIVTFLQGNTSSITVFPTICKLFLGFNAADANQIQVIIQDLRQCLNWKNLQNARSEINDNQLEVFNYIKTSLISSQILSGVWLKMIAAFEHPKPIDILILLVMMEIDEETVPNITQIIRKKIVASIYTKELIEEIVKDFPRILSEYLDVFLDVLDELFRNKESIVSLFSEQSYRLIFKIENCDRKVFISRLVDFACEQDSDSENEGIVEQTVVSNSLELLNDLHKDYIADMQKNDHQFLQILDQLNEYNLPQYRMVINILCSLAYPPAPLIASTELQTQIDMLVKKRVASGILSIKLQGIIGVARLVDHLAWLPPSDLNASIPDTEKTFNAIDEIPEGPGREAASLIELMFISSANCLESLTLSFDEVSLVFSAKSYHPPNKQIEKNFLMWLSDAITNDFQTYFITEDAPEYVGVELEYKYCLNSSTENTDIDSEVMKIAINIGGLTLRPNLECIKSSTTVLASLFNLMRTLHHRRYDGDLESINAVLGCAVILPKIFDTPDLIEQFTGLEVEMQKKFLDISFHTVNWFREVISGFVKQPDRMIRTKVLSRLTQLIAIEEQTRQLLRKAPLEYTPPLNGDLEQTLNSTVANENDLEEASRAIPMSVPAADTEGMSILGTVHPMNTTTGNLSVRVNAMKKKNLQNEAVSMCYSSKERYRQMSSDIILLLNEDLLVEYPTPVDKMGTVLALSEFKFIMDDLIIKLESQNGITKFVANQPQQQNRHAENFVGEITKYMPHILKFFHKLKLHLQRILIKAGGVHDHGELFTDEAIHIKICFGLCLRMMSALFSWSYFSDKINEPILIDCLFALNNEFCLGTGSNYNNDELAANIIANLSSQEDVVLDLRTAVHLFHLMKALAKIVNSKDADKYVVSICRLFLMRVWYSHEGSPERGVQCNILLNELLKGLFRNSSFKLIKKIIYWISVEIKLMKRKTDTLKTFPCFHKMNFLLLFRAVCDALIFAINKTTAKSVPTLDQLSSWELGCELLRELLEFAKESDIPRHFSLFLKYCHTALKIFLQSGITMIEQCIKNYPERIGNLLKCLQTLTRFLHNLCCHSKNIKNAAVLAQIPFLRKTIETLLHRIKGVLAVNKCSNLFWMGNLKNKDLKGDEILSQTSSLMTAEEEEVHQQDEESALLPWDDTTIDGINSTTMGSPPASSSTRRKSSRITVTKRGRRSKAY